MANLSRERIQQKTQDIRVLLVNRDPAAIPTLTSFVGRMRDQGRRLVYRNGDGFIAVGRPQEQVGAISAREPRLLIPGASLVLGQARESKVNDDVYLGGYFWYIGAATLALALDTLEASELDIVPHAVANTISSTYVSTMKPLIMNPGEFTLRVD